jgi:hypothetical protein
MSKETTTATSQSKTWYIRFNKNSGRILSIGPRPFVTTTEDEEVTASTNNVCKHLISGKKKINKYAVHWDLFNEVWDIDVKSSVLELKTKGEKLNQALERDPSICDVYIKVIRATNTIKMEINLTTIKQSLNLGQINSIKQDNTSILDLYLCRKNDPDYMIGVIPVDAIKLINERHLYIQVPPNITRHINSWDEISFFTKPVFECYGIEFSDVTISAADDNNQRPHQYANIGENAHINMYTLNDKLIIKSEVNPDTMYYFDNKPKLALHVSDKEIDNYVNTLTFNTAKLLNDKIEIDLPNDWPANPIITFKNKKLTVNYYGEKNE